MAIAESNRRRTWTTRPKDAENLDALIAMTGQREGEVLRAALRTERFVQETISEGSTLWIKDPDGTFREVTLLH